MFYFGRERIKAYHNIPRRWHGRKLLMTAAERLGHGLKTSGSVREGTVLSPPLMTNL